MDHMNADIQAHEAIMAQLRIALREFRNDANVDDLTDDAPLMDALESLGHFTFLLTLEGTFGVEIPDHRFTLVEMGTLTGIAKVLSEATLLAPDARCIAPGPKQ